MPDFDKERSLIKMVFDENAMGLKCAELNLFDKSLKMTNGRGEYYFPYGKGEFAFPRSGFRTLSQGSWCDDHTFLIRLNVIEEDFSPVYLQFGFGRDKNVSAHFKNTSEPECLRGLNGFAGGKVTDILLKM